MDKKQATQRLAELMANIQAAQGEAVAIATEHKIGFTMPYTTYGAGVSFDGEAVGKEGYWGGEMDGWMASSQSC